jgi:large subunit ribosomal protein L10
MSRAIKELVEADLKKRYLKEENLLVINVHGLSGVAANQLRGLLHKKNIEVHVVKNRAARRVLADTPLAPIGKSLSGPCAFVTGGTSPVDTAKYLLDLLKDFPALQLRQGIVEGETDPLSIEEISRRRSRAELQGEVVMLAVSPGRRLAGCLNVGGRVAGCLKAIIDKLEKGEAITRVA